MTLLRKLAVAISDRTVRWSSPGCKDWAEGLAHEVQFIPSDWRALAWSVGSLRVVFDRREAPIQSLDEIPSVAHRMGQADPAAIAPLSLTFFIWAGISFANSLRAHASLERTGDLLTSGGWICLCAFIYLGQNKNSNHVEKPIGDWTLFPSTDINAWTSFYKDALVRRLRRFQSSVFWLAACSMFCVTAGMAISAPIPALAAGMFGTLWVACAVWLVRARTKIERSLHRLNQLLAEQTGEEPQ